MKIVYTVYLLLMLFILKHHIVDEVHKLINLNIFVILTDIK